MPTPLWHVATRLHLPLMFSVQVAAGSEITATLPAGSKYASLVSGDVTVTVVSATQVKFKLNKCFGRCCQYHKSRIQGRNSLLWVASWHKVKYETGAVLREVDYPMVEYSLLEVTNVSPASATIAVNATQNYTVTEAKQSAATYSNNVKVVITHSTKGYPYRTCKVRLLWVPHLREAKPMC